MYLKRLDIQGFKSFPDKLKLEFNSGITAVVGPNGSGKSNISDAIRWVLGEQSAKSLRGAKMEDIIFTGTANRKALGFAEVSITLDNSDKILDIDFAEVTVTRRMYRSGESEYKINNSMCRLKDIHELFTDTGIGKEGYSIIGQGRIDEILSTKSEDRRNMFEEAAGILKFKNRREEARAKLEKESQNLERVNDIISTLESQIEPLKAQSEKARKYLNLKERLKLLEVNIFLIETQKIEKNILNVDENMSVTQNHLDTERLKYNDLKLQQQSLKQRLEDYNLNLQNIQKEFYSISSDIEKNNSDIKLMEQQIEHIYQNIDRIQNEIDKKIDILKNLNSSKNELKSKYNSILLQIDSQNQILQLNQNKFYELNRVLNQNENMIESYNNQIVSKIKQIASIKTDINSFEAQCNQLTQTQSQQKLDIQHNKSKIKDKSIHIEALKKSKAESAEIENKILNSIKKAENDRIEFQNNLKVEREYIDLLTSSINQMQSNYKYLETTQKEHRGFSESVKNILKAKDSDSQYWKGIYGVLGELIDVDKEYEVAIEIALGANINNIITATEKDAQIAIEYLKKTKGGRATFFPLTAIQSKKIELDIKKLSSEVGFISVASNLVKCESVYEEIVRNILGRVIVVDNLSNAVLMAKKYRYSYRIVTLEGDLINTGGSLTGGSKAQNSLNILGRSKEIEDMFKKIQDLKIELSHKKENIKSIYENIEDINSMIDDKNREYQNNHIDIMSFTQQIQQTESFILEMHSKNNSLLEEQNKIATKIVKIESNLKQLKVKLNETESESEKIQNQMDEFQNNIQSDRTDRETLLNQITESKVKISALEQEKTSCEENLKRIENDISDSQNYIDISKQDIESLKCDLDRKNTLIDNTNKSIENYKSMYSEKNQQLQLEQQNKAECSKHIEAVEEKIETGLESISVLEKEILKIENQKTKLLDTKQNLYNHISEEYEITYEIAKGYRNPQLSNSQMQKESKQLKSEIKQMGSINVDAIEEYKHVNERFQFMSSQRDDIIEAEKKLQRIIGELTDSMSKQFTEQFKLISDNFSQVFKEMFRGGKAYLQLDGENVLESGIDIIAQPPGKNLQNMMLLSGGERALTAIALLFAILKLKPSPFCILDEIEAALDDANVNRYADYLKKFSKVTQFIVVTHRKGTMEAADVMYGVTMQEQGVSKLVSVKFVQQI